MKKICSIVAVISVMFLSCSKISETETGSGENGNEIVLNARIANDTKTYFEAEGTSGMKLLWSKNDCIDVASGALNSHVFSMKEVEGQGAGYANATFAGKIAAGEKPEAALYPSGSISLLEYYDIKTLFGEGPLPPELENAKNYYFLGFDSLLENQTYSPNPDGHLNYMFSPVVGDELAFSNLCSYFKFQLKGDTKVGKVVMSASYPSAVSFYVLGVITDNDGKVMLIEPVVKTHTDISSHSSWSEWSNPIDEITLDCGEGVQLSNEQKPFYIAVNSQFFEKGFTLRIFDTEGNLLYYKTNDNKIELKPGQIQPIAPITLNSSSAIKTINPISSLYVIPGEDASSGTMILCEEGLSVDKATGDFTGQGRAVQFGITCGSKFSESQWDGKTENARLISKDSQAGTIDNSSITDIYTSFRDCGVDSNGNNLVSGEVSFACNSEKYTLFFNDLYNLFSSDPVTPQPGTVTLTISTFQDTKSSVRDNGELILSKGELVSVNGAMFQIEEDGHTQRLTVPYCELGYDVVYPAELFDGSMSVKDGEYSVSVIHSYTQTDQPKPLMFAHITNESLYGNLINSDGTFRIGLAEGFKPSYVVMNATGENAHLWGNFKYKYTGGSLSGIDYQAPEDGSDQKSIKITIDPSSQYHYFNIPPCTMSGFTLTFYNEAGDILQQKTMTREITVNAGMLYALGSFDYSEEHQYARSKIVGAWVPEGDVSGENRPLVFNADGTGFYPLTRGDTGHSNPMTYDFDGHSLKMDLYTGDGTPFVIGASIQTITDEYMIWDAPTYVKFLRVEETPSTSSAIVGKWNLIKTEVRYSYYPNTSRSYTTTEYPGGYFLFTSDGRVKTNSEGGGTVEFEYNYNPSSEILKFDGKVFSFARIEGDDMVFTIGPMGPKFPDGYGDFHSEVIKIYLKRDSENQ